MAQTVKNSDNNNVKRENIYRNDIYKEAPVYAGSSSKTTGRNAKTGKKRKNTGRKKNNRKNNEGIAGPLIGLLFGSSTVALLLLVVLLVQTIGKPSIKNYGQAGNNSGKTYSADEEYINIDADSFMGYVGQTYTLSLSANPVDLVESAIWSSSNEDSVLVDEKGQVVLVGEGVSAVTVTAGQYSSAIAIEVVKDASEQGNMGFDTIGQKNNVSSDAETRASEDNGSDSGNTYENVTASGESYAGENATEPVTDAAGEVNRSDSNVAQESTASGENNGTQQETTSHEETVQETETEFVPPTTKAAEAIDTQEMFSVLSRTGFSQYLPNAAIYDVDGEYYGEVIVQSDSVHIYIKKRSVEFDMAVRGALAYLLPDTSESVWNVYTTLSKDKTINSDGRKVRFVMAAANAHSQIIVYNP